MIFKNPLHNYLPANFFKRGKTSSGYFKVILFSALFLGLNIFALIPNSVSQIFATHTKTQFKGPNNSSTLVGIVNGPAIPVNIQVTDFHDSDGLAAYEFTANFDNRYLSIPDSDQDGVVDTGVVTSGPLLTSSGKGSLCPDSIIAVSQTDPNISELNVSCGTMGSTPAGPQGSGNLVTINFTPRNLIGTTSLTLFESYLLDNTANANEVAHAKFSTNVPIAKCAFLDTFAAVTITDIARIVQYFGTSSSSPNWNPAADLNADNAVTVNDITLAVSQFGKQCPT